jgi:hypothetical protein
MCARSFVCHYVIYGCGDASSLGFGSAFVANGKYVCDGFDKFDNSSANCIGVWGLDMGEESSNYSEL